MNLTPMIFGKVNELTAEATITIKSLVVVAAIVGICWILFKREGSGKLVLAAITAGAAVWLVAGGGVETVSGLFGSTIES